MSSSGTARSVAPEAWVGLAIKDHDLGRNQVLVAVGVRIGSEPDRQQAGQLPSGKGVLEDVVAKQRVRIADGGAIHDDLNRHTGRVCSHVRGA